MQVGDGKLSDYNKAIAASPKDAELYCNRGAYYRTQKQFDKSIAELPEGREARSEKRQAARRINQGLPGSEKRRSSVGRI